MASLIALTVSGCAGRLVATPPQPEDEVARLKREITKVRFAIDSTKTLIARSRGQQYLADLYLRLAELYIEEARYHYFIAYEGQKRRSRAVDAVQPRLLKNQAISVYKRILDEYPDFAHRDKVLFFISHEYRELGDYPRMLDYLKRVVREHPKSVYRNEALLVLGDYHFDRSELFRAGQYYKQIIRSPESPSHGMARYKQAWVEINAENFKSALKLFEATIEGLEKAEQEALGSVDRRGNARRIDLRREALVDLVFPYTEVYKKAKPASSLRYFKRLADSRTTYLAALSKLAKRWFVKGEFKTASGIYREILRLGADNEDSVEWARRLYDGVVKGKLYAHVSTDVSILVDVVARRHNDWRITEDARKQIYEEFEVYARDLATKAQLRATSGKTKKTLLMKTGDAYDEYLAFFGESEKAPEIRENLAETRFAAGQYLLAGRAYAALIPGLEKEGQKKAIRTSVAAYSKALERPWLLSRVDTLQARAGLRSAARQFIDRFSKDGTVAAVKFNFAKSYYDEGQFEDAAELFAALVDQFPASEEASISAELALDALRSEEKFEEMAELGGRFSDDKRLPEKLRTEIAAIVKSAESRALEVATLEAGYQGEVASEALLAFADRHRGTPLGERALINAFATARNSDDLEQVEQIGERLIKEYPRSRVITDVLATLGKMSAQAADFDRAAKYLEDAAATRKQDETAIGLLEASALMKAQLGDIDGAQRTYTRVIKAAPNPAARREAALAFADVVEQNGDYGRVAEALSMAADEGASSATLKFRLGYALMRSGDDGEAVGHLQDALRAGQSANAPEELEAAAAAAYYLAEPLYDVFAEVKGGAEAIQEKFAALTDFEDAMFEVIGLENPKWALAALARLATAYTAAAEFLTKAPAPAGLDKAGTDRFKAALGEKADEMRSKSTEAIETCASKAKELKVFSTAVKACLTGRGFSGDPSARPRLASRRAPSGGKVKSLRQRIAKNSKDYDALVELAQLYIDANDPLAAKLVLDKASEGGANAATYNLRGVVFHLLGYPQAAYDDFSSALEEDSANVRARLNLAALFRTYGYKVEADAEEVKVKDTKGIDRRTDVALLPEARRGAAGGGRGSTP